MTLPFNTLLDKTFSKVERDDDSITFWLNDTQYYKLHHEQDCCEDVSIESIVGDLLDLGGVPIWRAEESINKGELVDDSIGYDSFTWSFYKLATIKGYVDIRFYGQSNGYYSESVDLEYFDTGL